MSNAGQAIGAVAGGAIGFFLGGPLGLVQGASLGLTAGSILFPTKLPNVQGPRLEDLTVTLSTYGSPIPLIYGVFRAAGNIIWATDLVEVSSTTKQKGKGGGGQKVTNFSYFGNFAVAVNGREISSIRRIWANKKIVFDVDSPDNPTPVVLSDGVSLLYDFPGRGEIRIYHGNQTIPDDKITAVEGVANTPNYKEIAYLVFTGSNGYALADFGNSIPNIEVEIEADDYIQVGDVIRDICNRMGAPVTSEMWVDDELMGYAVSSQTNAVDALIPLSLAYDFDMIEELHQITVINRPRALVATIDYDDLAAHGDGGSAPDLLPLVRAYEDSVPVRVDVTYPDPEYDYQTGVQSLQRVQVNGDLVRDVQLPVVVTAAMARQVAARVMWGQAGERVTATINLSDKWQHLRAGDAIALPVPGGYLPFRIVNVIRGQDATIRMDVTYDDAAAYLYGLPGAELPPTGNIFKQPEISTWIVIDTTMLTADSTTTGFYWGMHSGPNWKGATFERSTDGVNFSIIAGEALKAFIGDVSAALPAGSSTVWDEINTITVVMRSDDVPLDSATAEEVYNGANAFWLGDLDGNANGEIIQFRDATLTAPNTYLLSGLLRGRLATDFAIPLHGTNEVFVLLQPNVFDADFGSTDWNLVRQYVAYSRYVDESLVTPRDFTNTGERARPRSPVHVHGERDGSFNLTITWVPRTRIPTTGLAVLVPLGEAIEAYEIDILSGVTVVRTITASTPTAVYTAAEQTTDGFTPGDPIDMVIYQMSNIRGRGHGREATV